MSSSVISGVLIIMLIVYVLISMLVCGIDMCMLLVIMGSRFIGENLVVLMLNVLVVSVSSGSVVLLLGWDGEEVVVFM